jgi:hypothetical protein
MSVVHKPNLNFDKETKTHVPYSVLMSGSMESSIERFRKPKKLVEKKTKKSKPEKTIQKDTKAFKKWFI